MFEYLLRYWQGHQKTRFLLTGDLVSITVITIADKTLNIHQDGEPSVMLIQLIKNDLFFFMIVNSVEVAELNNSDTQIFIIRNKKLF